MHISETPALEKEYLAYDGSTIVARILDVGDGFPRRDWLLFDTVEEAEDFYNENRLAGANAVWGCRC